MTTLSIPDMSCGHCRASITAALELVPGVEKISYNPEARTADISGPAPVAVLITALDAIGFPATAA